MNEQVILIDEVAIRCSYSFTPGEEEVRYDNNMTGHPGSPAEVDDVEILSIEEGELDALVSYVNDYKDDIYLKLAEILLEEELKNRE